MNECGNFLEIHENMSGTIGYCVGCSCFHLTVKGVLSILTKSQLENVDKNLNQMRSDLMNHHNKQEIKAGVQIKLAANIYLCLNYKEIANTIELIEMGSYMQYIQDIVNS